MLCSLFFSTVVLLEAAPPPAWKAPEKAPPILAPAEEVVSVVSLTVLEEWDGGSDGCCLDTSRDGMIEGQVGTGSERQGRRERKCLL